MAMVFEAPVVCRPCTELIRAERPGANVAVIIRIRAACRRPPARIHECHGANTSRTGCCCTGRHYQGEVPPAGVTR